MGKEDWGTGATATTAIAMGHRSRSNRTVIAMAMGQRSIVFYIAAQNVDNSGW
jgi:hypothetical protein